MRNKEVADLFQKIGTLLEIKGEIIFKIRAYYKAAENILNLSEDIETLKNEDRLSEIPGIGQALKDKIIEYLETGKVKAYAEIIREVPESLLGIVEIPSIGPKKAKLFFEKLKIRTVDDLRKAAEDGSLLKLPGIRAKTVENILRGIKVVRQGQERMNLGTATQAAEIFVNQLRNIPEVKEISVSGSLRRGCETIGDIDILVDSADPKKVMDAFIHLPAVKHVNAHGDTKSSILSDNNVQVDLRIVEPESFGAALLYFTGSKSFNVKLRQLAQKKDMKVNEYGVFSIKGKKEKCLASRTEEECFKVLGMPFAPPELREEIGETDLFPEKGVAPKIPKLIEQADIRGEFHVHSTYSDGRHSIEQMVQTAISKGYEYLAISDHSQRLRVAGGVSPEDLKKKKKEIDELNKRLKNFRVLFGTELEIDTEGKLDYNEAILSEFDIVIAAIHSGFEQDEKKITQRLVKACQSKYVNIIAHPTGVHIGKREPYAVNFKELCQAAVDHNVFLEINSFPFRLDLNSANVYFARKAGVKFVINTDSHAMEHMDLMRFGISIARRGWVTKEDVLNTRSLKDVEKLIVK